MQSFVNNSYLLTWLATWMMHCSKTGYTFNTNSICFTFPFSIDSLKSSSWMHLCFSVNYRIFFLKDLVCWLNTDFMQLFPWGGKLTSESIKFFSPIVIWTKFTSNPQKYDILYSAFREYYKVITPASWSTSWMTIHILPNTLSIPIYKTFQLIHTL